MQAERVVFDQGDNTVYRFDALGTGVLGIRHPPEGTPQRVAGVFADAVSHLISLNAEAQALRADPHVVIDPEGRAQRLEPSRLRVEKAVVETAKLELRNLEQELTAKEEAIYAPPALEKDDNPGIKADERLCDHFNGLSLEKRTKVLKEMQRGEHRKMLMAVVRDVVPTEERKLALGIWREIVAQEQKQKVRELVRFRNGVEWLKVGLNAMPRHIPKRAP